MRIAILIDELRFGGVEKVAIEETKALTAIGHEAVLVILRRTKSEAYSDISRDIKKAYISDLFPRPLRFSFRLPFFRFFSLFHLTYAALIRFVPIRIRFDVVISHGTFTCFSGIMLAKSKSIPSIGFIWDPVLHIVRSVYLKPKSLKSLILGPIAIALATSLDKWICRNARRIVTASNHHIAYLKQITQDPRDVRIIVPGVTVRSSPKVLRQPYVVISTAWKAGKQPEYVLELARQVNNLEFVMAGAWITQSMKNSFLNDASKLGPGNRVVVTGPIEEGRLLDLYAEALVFLQIRADVGFGLPALEAAGQGCTFIIPNGQGVCDLFHPSDGFVVRERDTNQIAKILRHLTENHDDAVAMGRNAWRVAQMFSWNHHARELGNIAVECSTSSSA